MKDLEMSMKMDLVSRLWKHGHYPVIEGLRRIGGGWRVVCVRRMGGGWRVVCVRRMVGGGWCVLGGWWVEGGVC